MVEPEKTTRLVNLEKAKISPQYENWYEATYEDPQMETRVRLLKNDLFEDVVTSSGRKLSEIFVTAEELAEQGAYTFTQEDVTNYDSNSSIKERRRTLDKGPIFEPKVVLSDIISSSQREDREEGLNRSSYQKMMEREVVKHLVTSGLPPIEVLSLFAKVTQLSNKEEWIDPDEWEGTQRVESEEVEVRLAQQMANRLGINLENLVEHQHRVAKINASAPTYINTHFQHSVPHSQGGLSQRPVAISSHWFEHCIQASDAEEALLILLAERGLGEKNDPDALERLIELTFFAYQTNSQAAELLRSSIPLSPGLSTKYIREKRVDVCSKTTEILNETIQLDTGRHLDILTEEDKVNITSLARRIEENRGTLETEDTEEDEPIISPEERIALEKLEMAVELIDRDKAVNRLKTSLDTLKAVDKKKLSKEDTIQIKHIIERLEKGTSALYLQDINEDEYNSLLSLQEILDEDILLDVVVPTKIRNVRPSWRYRLDLEVMGDVLVNPYDDKGLELRMLLDILQEPVFDRVFLTGSPPRRSEFSREQLLDPSLSDKIYGDLRHVDLLEGIVSNEVLNQYYKSFGIESRGELFKTMFPEKEHEEPPSVLQNVDRAAELVYEAVISNNKIATIGDCDQDGFFASINWRWVLEHVGVENIQQKFNTRLEGHAVQPVDLLNLALDGNDLIIINDTGSSEKDSETFSLIKNGATKVKDIAFFRKNIRHINGFRDLTEHEQRQIKGKLTRYINIHNEEEDIDPAELFQLKFTTGNMIKNRFGNLVKEYKALGEYLPLFKFVEGFNDIKIIVCDHHTPSIAATKYFKDNPDMIMVNPEWVRSGYEDKFIAEMNEALVPDENGKVDIEKINEAQRRYVCYPESDIVGTVTAGKVMKRFLQLLTDNEVVKNNDTTLYSLEKEKRKEKYREIAKEVSNVTLYEKEKKQEGLPSYFTFKYGEDVKVKLFFGDLWLENNSLEKIESRMTEVVNSLNSRIEKIKKLDDREEQEEYLRDLENKWPVSIPNKDDFLDLFSDDDFLFTNHYSFSGTGRINRAIRQIREVHNQRVEELLEKKRLTKEELRFYLEYAGLLPQSFFTLSRHEKIDYIIPHLATLAKKIEENSNLSGREEDFTINLQEEIDKIIEEEGTLRDIKLRFFDLIEKGYDNNGGVPVNPRTHEVPDTRSKVRYEGNKIWQKSITDLLESKEFTPMIMRSLESFLEYGPYGLEFLKLTEATATLGDGGSVALEDGLENRIIVKNGMEAIEAFADDYWDADEEEKKKLKRIQPEILRLIINSLRGTHIKSVNWHLSRLLTHGISAFVNAMYRRGKEERSQRAKEFWAEAAEFCTRRSENENTRRHRHTLVHAQEVSIERREEMFEEIVKELENDHGEIDKPIIITKLDGIKYVDPVKGMRGLIAGQLADRYTKPVMVVVEEKAETKTAPARYSLSFRLPAKGNIATDMVQLQLEMNPVEGIEVKAHGGHPEAAGGTWEVYGGLEKLHEVLDPIFTDFEIENPDAGVVKVEKIIEKTLEELGEGNWDYLEEYKGFVNPFDISDTIAANMYKQTNPYGVGMPGLVLEFEDLTIVSKSKGLKNDGDEYCNLRVRDKRGNIKEMRLFKNLADLDNIEKGDTVRLRAQPIMRLRPLEEGSLEYSWPLPDYSDEKFTVNTVIGQKARPYLDIDRILNVNEGDYISE